MKYQIEELKELIATRLDVTEFLDLIGYSMFDLVEALETEIEDNQEELSKAVD